MTRDQAINGTATNPATGRRETCRAYFFLFGRARFYTFFSGEPEPGKAYPAYGPDRVTDFEPFSPTSRFPDLKSQAEIDEEEQISAAHKLGVVICYLLIAWLVGCGLFVVLMVR